MRSLILLTLLFCVPALAAADQATTPVTAPAASTAGTLPSSLFPSANTAATNTLATTETAADTEDARITARLTDIRATLESRRNYANYWYYGWLSFYGATTVGQVVIGALSDDRNTRGGNYVGAFTSLLGVSGMLISPVPTGSSVADKVQSLPSKTPDERKASLQEAERIWSQTQEAEIRARHWTEHLMGALVTGGAAAFMYFYYDDWENAALKVGSGILFGQTRPLTGPIAHHDFWHSYGQEPQPQLPASVTSGPPFRIMATPRGILATLTF